MLLKTKTHFFSNNFLRGHSLAVCIVSGKHLLIVNCLSLCVCVGGGGGVIQVAGW